MWILQLMWFMLISYYFIDSLFQFRKGELRMQSLTFDDAGMYQCIAENMHGIIYANAELKIVGQWDYFSIYYLGWVRQQLYLQVLFGYRFL